MTTIVASNTTHEAVGVDMKLGGASFGSGPKSACGGQASGLDQQVGAFDLDQGQASGEDRKVEGGGNLLKLTSNIYIITK